MMTEDEDDYEGVDVNEQAEEDENQVEEAVIPVQVEEAVLPLPAQTEQIVNPIRLFRHDRANWGTERPILDRLAEEIFGPSQRTTRSGGPVAAVPLPDRPVEYKKNKKKKK